MLFMHFNAYFYACYLTQFMKFHLSFLRFEVNLKNQKTTKDIKIACIPVKKITVHI